MATMRDAFFDKLYELAKKDRDVVLVSADMGAPSLDKFRRDLSSQYVNTGIAESNAVAVGAGLALSGKKVFVYAIAPFVTSRVYEYLKLEMSLMEIPLTIVGVGAGYSYIDSGPTHHTTEDISIMRVLPNIEILNPSDELMAAAFARHAYYSHHPIYIRLDRMPLNIKHPIDNSSSAFASGFRELRKGDNCCIVATGNTVDDALEIADDVDTGLAIGVIDVYRLKPIPNRLIDCLRKYKHIISWEEHLLAGGLGSIIAELIVDNHLIAPQLHRIGVDDEYVYEYGTREDIQWELGIDKNRVIKKIKEIIT